MQKIRVGICISDEEYQSRFVSCLMNHYKSQLELYIYTGYDQLILSESMKLNVVIASDCMNSQQELEEIRLRLGAYIVYLVDEEEGYVDITEKEGEVMVLEKYQEVNEIIEEILKNVGSEIKEVQEYGRIRAKTRVAAVYSLSENEYQLPFAVTLGSILSEKEKVLVLDFQENSGFSQLIGRGDNPGLEELLIMAESGKYSYGRLASCVGHIEGVDFAYPINNSENLCEINASIFLKLIQMISQEMNYDVILINLGGRFQGFYEVLNRCQELYLMQKRGGLCQWREMEFLSDIRNCGYSNLESRIIKVEIPILSNPVTSCERLIEQWRWNEFGDLIRNKLAGAYALG